jgi:Ca-activated chloride channel family protein
MSGIVFDSPWALLGFAVFIPLILYDYFSSRGKQIHKSLPQNLKTQLTMSRIFFRIFLAGIIIAFAGPRWGTGQGANIYRQALDVVIALDISRSMEIRDGQDAAASMSRLERGLAIVRNTITAAPGTRFAVAVSRNRGIVAVPLTWDSGAVFAFLDGAGSSLTGRGTNLEALVNAAAGAFQPSFPSARVILLVSDGEETSGSLKIALEHCKREGIIVSAIALGSDEGGYLPGDEDILSRRDSSTLRTAAGQTGGIYIDGNREDAPRALASHLRSLAPGSEAMGNNTGRKARWPLCIALAIIALGASKLSLLKWRNRE